MSFLKSASFQKRALSSVVLGPLVLLIVWYGSWPFLIVLMGAFVLAFKEWLGLLKNFNWAPFYAANGALYIAGGLYCLFLLRGYSLELLFLFLFSIWASDIGAYFFGKFIGGRKLIPRVSPNKTWAGLGGAVLCPVFIFLLYAFAGKYFSALGNLNADEINFSIFAGTLVGLSGQVGDLLISAIKRKAGAKDTGDIIPGHGGLLDRIDSLLLAAPVFYCVFSFYLSVGLSGIL